MKHKGLLVSIAVGVALTVGLFFLLKEKPIVVTMQDILPDGIPVEGPATSTVTIVEFLDFQCPSCGAFHPIMKQIREEYAGKIRYAQRQFILPEVHEFAKGASIAAVCAGKQQKYFEYADALIVNQQRLTRNDLLQYASALRLDDASFRACLDDAAVASFVADERTKGQTQLGINGTPTLFINDEQIQGIPTVEQLRRLISAKL